MILHLIDGPVDKAPQYLSTVVRVQQNVVPSPAVAQLQTVLLIRIQARSSQRAACRAAFKLSGGRGGGGRGEGRHAQSMQCWDCLHPPHGAQSNQPCCCDCQSNDQLGQATTCVTCSHSYVHARTHLLVCQGQALVKAQTSATICIQAVLSKSASLQSSV